MSELYVELSHDFHSTRCRLLQYFVNFNLLYNYSKNCMRYMCKSLLKMTKLYIL